MSILNKLKKLNSSSAAQLFERHPLAVESLEMRLQYLAGLALATAIDREPTETERQAFSALANSLSVDAADAEEQLNERASVNENDIAVLFDAIRQKNATWFYLLDLAVLHAADNNHGENEVAMVEYLSTLLEVNSSGTPDATKSLYDFVLAIMHKQRAKIIKLLPALSNDERLKKCLQLLLKSCFPFARVIQSRWIDHGDGTVSDSKTGLMWMRFCLGEEWRDGQVYGNPALCIVAPGFFEPTRPRFRNAISELNDKKSLGGHSDWRLPRESEIASIVTGITTQSSDDNHPWKLDWDLIFRPSQLTDRVLFVNEYGDNYFAIVEDDSKLEHWTILPGGDDYSKSCRALLCRNF